MRKRINGALAPFAGLLGAAGLVLACIWDGAKRW
jgi:hypothetical protein